tara:strand:+ start:7204 stop:8103 length:900 start_codon:yes stop_codon:yes gene_type:complete
MSDEIKDILTEIGYTLRDCGNEYRAKPLYRDSDNPNVLCIKKSNGLWFDFKTSKYGNLEELVKITLNLKDINEAKDFIKNKFDFSDVKRVKEKLKSQKIFNKENLNRIIPNYKYWNDRGVSSETLKTFQSGIMEDGKLKDRYVFPVFDKMDRLIGAAGRDLYDQSPMKWKLLGEKSLWIYPFKYNYSYIKKQKSVFLIESIGDMLSLWEAGIRNTLVLFGLTASSKIKQILISLNLEKISISLNNDDVNGAGNNASETIKKDLLNYFDDQQLQVNLPPKNDFGCMNTSEIVTWKKQLKM